VKVIKSKKYIKSQQLVSYQQIFDEAVQSNNGDVKQAAEAVLDLATNGMWAVWDQNKIDSAIQTILKQFGNTGI